MSRWGREEGAPVPLGVSWVEGEQAYNFAIYSKHAESVTLLLYREDDWVTPVLTLRLDYLVNKSGRVWHCRVPASRAAGARYYAYSIDGPAPAGRFEWHAFDPDKILLDPAARAVFFPPTFDRRAAIGRGPNAGKAPLGVLQGPEPTFDWAKDPLPRHESDLVIYELHVRGFTRNPNSGVSPGRHGTYAGLVEKIPYLRDLGVTAVELMPVFQFDPQEGNYWGYMPLSFFAPHHAYASAAGQPDACREFCAMVRALHEADIEVILDVVYNHTVEGDHRGPTYSGKGIDNSTYYMLSGDPAAPYLNFSGTGNTVHCANRYIRGLLLGSLRYWARHMRVDGFRFDLASIMSRRDDGSIDYDDPPIFGDIAADPALARVRLIAEPWDAAGAYQLGRSFPGLGWLQWNDRFRDDVRRFVRGDPGLVPAVMSRLYGSDDLFSDALPYAFHPWQSVNYVTAHDGFTLFDLVAYREKRNWANGHGNTDGSPEEHSWNCGWEGAAGAPAAVTRLRKQQAKNFACLLFLANGTPMLRAGDEFLHTQGGNSNPYNQDNATTWLDWNRLEANRDVHRFLRRLIAFRKAHPSLGRSRFWRHDVRWYGAGPTVDTSPESHGLAFFLGGASQGDQDLYVMINAGGEDLPFAIQEVGPWKRVADTSLESPHDICDPGTEVPLTPAPYSVRAHSVVVLVRA
jgi:glycogen operon protein